MFTLSERVRWSFGGKPKNYVFTLLFHDTRALSLNYIEQNEINFTRYKLKYTKNMKIKQKHNMSFQTSHQNSTITTIVNSYCRQSNTYLEGLVLVLYVLAGDLYEWLDRIAKSCRIVKKTGLRKNNLKKVVTINDPLIVNTKNNQKLLTMLFAPELRTHNQKVCTLYKNACRMIDCYYHAKQLIRYHRVILRNEFDNNKGICDPKDQRRLLWLGEYELAKKKHPVPIKFATSVGGVAHERVVQPFDWVLDYWHPLEKAQYPEYFKRRECRKCEYITHWNNKTLM